jgi:GNAT superfamily N-acetyltransferase
MCGSSSDGQDDRRMGAPTLRACHDRLMRCVPATPERWDDVVAIMGVKGDAARCWCQFFRQPNAQYRASTDEARRAALHAQLAGGVAPGVLVHDDVDEPIGWCGIAPRRDYARLGRSEIAKATNDADGLWSVVCFVVRVGHRSQGATGELLAAAVELARSNGAAAIEAYPVDTTAVPRVTSADLHHGALPVFLRAGFREVARPKPGRPTVRLQLR